MRNNNPDLATAGLMMVVGCGMVIAVVLFAVFFFLSLQKALTKCRPRNRTMEPAMVWLNFIPLFNLYWCFHTVAAVSNSLKNEFADRGANDGSDYGKGLGISGCAIHIAGNLLATALNTAATLTAVGNMQQPDPLPMGTIIGTPIQLIGWVIGIVYWVKIAGYSAALDHVSRDDGSRRFDDDEDDDDYQPRAPRNSGSTDIRAGDDVL